MQYSGYKQWHHQSLEGKKFLVTGGAGFIGSHIVAYLLQYGAGHVRVLDNLSTGFMNNITPFLTHPAFEWIKGDIRDPSMCCQATEDMDYVSHQAALGSVPRSIEDPVTTNEVNIGGFVNMLYAAKETGVKRMVYASSSSVYGDHPDLPKKEEKTGNVLSPYAVTKYVDELYARVFSGIYSFHTIGFRYFNIFGPRQNPEGAYAAVIPRFIKAVKEARPPVIYGDGTTSRDFTYVSLAVQANIRGMLLPELPRQEVINIAAGGRTTLTELAQLIISRAGAAVQPVYAGERVGDIRHSLADISKAKKLIGYEPDISLEEGLERTMKNL